MEKDEDKEDIAWEWREIDKIMSTLSQRKTEEKHSGGDGIEGDPGTEGFDSGFGVAGDQGVREKEKLDAVNTAKKKSRTGDAREGNRTPSLRCVHIRIRINLIRPMIYFDLFSVWLKCR